MMFLEGNIAAPPTITVFSCAETGAATVAVRASAANAAADNNAIRFDMDSLPMIELTGGAFAGDEGGTTTLAGLGASSFARNTGGFSRRVWGVKFCVPWK